MSESINKSNECFHNHHSDCQPCQCECHKNPLELTKEEAEALVIELQHNYISLERQRIIYDLIHRLREAISK